MKRNFFIHWSFSVLLLCGVVRGSYRLRSRDQRIRGLQRNRVKEETAEEAKCRPRST